MGYESYDDNDCVVALMKTLRIPVTKEKYRELSHSRRIIQSLNSEIEAELCSKLTK
jgi:hypothetical protein